MAVPAGFLVDRDAEILCGRHSNELFVVRGDIVLDVKYFLASCDG